MFSLQLKKQIKNSLYVEISTQMSGLKKIVVFLIRIKNLIVSNEFLRNYLLVLRKVHFSDSQP